MNVVDLSKISLDPLFTFSSGQTFRWRRTEEHGESVWSGVVKGHLIKVRKKRAECIAISKVQNAKENLDFAKLVSDYFSFKDDPEFIYGTFPHERYLLDALDQFRGLRILTQDPWECLISFICSINKNIPSIISMIELLSEKFGDKITNSWDQPYAFPSPSELAAASKNDLLQCKVGFRWRFIQFVARRVNSGKLDLASQSNKSYRDARDSLVSEISGSTFGVGPKVADCVLLFSFHKTEAFPVDVWILRCIRSQYAEKLGVAGLLKGRNSLTPRMYELLHEKLFEYFGNYCGYAQQYLYMKFRSDSTRNKVLV